MLELGTWDSAASSLSLATCTATWSNGADGVAKLTHDFDTANREFLLAPHEVIIQKRDLSRFYQFQPGVLNILAGGVGFRLSRGWRPMLLSRKNAGARSSPLCGLALIPSRSTYCRLTGQLTSPESKPMRPGTVPTLSVISKSRLR